MGDLFAPLLTDKPHVSFVRLRASRAHGGARRLMNELFDRMGDPDGNFVKEFQGQAFHSRLFELACFGYLAEQGWIIDRRQRRPDFLVTKGGCRIAVEAVTSNSPLGQDIDIAVSQIIEVDESEIVDKCDNEFPIRIGSALWSKLAKRYWELTHCQELPFVLIVGPFHEPGSTTYIDESLARYLYGVERFGTWIERGGVLLREAPVREHLFEGKMIPSNLFGVDSAKHLSAVVWCNQFTVPRFFRIAAEVEGLPDDVASAVNTGVCAENDGCMVSEYEYTVGDGRFPRETWSRGVTVLHNPHATIPLPEQALACTSEFRLRHGRLMREVHGFHPLTSFLHIQGAKRFTRQDSFPRSR